MNLKMVKLNCLTLGELENLLIFNKKWSVPLSLELMDITRDWVSSLCQAFTAADLSYCFVCGSFCLWFWVEIRRLTQPLQNIPLFTLCVWVAFAACFGSSSISTMKHYPYTFQHPSGCLCPSSINTSNYVPLKAMHAHAITLLLHVSQMMLYALDHELFQAFSMLFSPCHSGTGLS